MTDAPQQTEPSVDSALLDRRVICDLLGFDESVYEAVRHLAAKWCAEPSVHGGKQQSAEWESWIASSLLYRT